MSKAKNLQTGHIGLNVTDLDRSLAFYREVFSGGIFFSDPDGIRLEIYAPTGADPADAPTSGAPTCGFF
ncbi:VOC family protein [Streptomyces anulatus]|uniref:VOC family protein n=1 Tax=Streptomyces anulatus TaxID=1892 RepID=UPI00343C0A7F